ncbi:MAG: carbohydrate binding family 9 domain-containing protein, partial [Woeseia sp.]
MAVRDCFTGALLTLLVVPGILTAQELTGFGERPRMEAAVLDRLPVLDGDVLNDPAWQGMQPATGFRQIQPAEGRPASQKTEVYLGYSDSALYIGVIAWDDNPSGIIVSDSRRDSSLADTDSFQIVIDGLRDRQNGFVFGTNPAGIQYDGQVTREGSSDFGSGGGGFNLNWDASWNVRAAISEIGWSAEFEIPFRTLRYGSGDGQTWGINFQRNIRRNNEVAFWAPLSRQRNLFR